jgi:hypothetical protein
LLTLGPARTSFFFNPFRSRFLYLLVGAHFLLAAGLGRVFAFAPDENLYLGVFHRVYQRGFSTGSVLGWSNSQTFFLRVLYLPAKVLTMIGVSDYLAIRILAIAASGIAIYLLMCASRGENNFRVPRHYQILLFTPSLFLWMTLGLRESFIYLALSMICVGFYLIGNERERVGFLFLFFGNLIIFETKSYLFLLVAFAALVAVGFVLASRGKRKLIQGYVVLAVVLPAIMNPLGVSSLSASIKSQLSSFSSVGSATIAPVANSNAQSASENAATTTAGLTAAISSHPDSVFSKILTGFGFTGGESSTGPSGPTTVHYLTSRLNVTPAHFSDPISIVSRTGGFLFTPFPFIDNGSLFENLASFESPFWWFLYIAFGVVIWRRVRHKAIDGFFVFILGFSILFILFSAFTEINVGTMARHRSVLFIPILYLTVASYKEKYKEVASR